MVPPVHRRTDDEHDSYRLFRLALSRLRRQPRPGRLCRVALLSQIGGMTKGNSAQWLLLVAVFVIATCGLIYELVAGTLASYGLGDSITQFSTIIGGYRFSMGGGSFLSKYFEDN